MKRLSLLALLLLFTGVLAAKEYKVSTAHDFIKALGSDRIITVSGVINLSDVMEFDDHAQKANMSDLPAGAEPSKQVNREGVFDGYQLVLDQCKNLVIQGAKGAALIVRPRYSYVISFRNAHNITLRNLTMGHTDEGYCSGGVLEFDGCDGVQIDRCDLYGCGTEGITATNTREMKFTKSIIRDCSYSIMTLRNCFNALFADSDFYRCCEYTLITLTNATNTAFTRCRFAQNQGPLFYVDKTNLSLRDCEIHHSGDLGNIDIYQYGTTSYSRDNNELSPRDVGPEGRQDLKASREQEKEVASSEDGEPNEGEGDCECGEGEEEECTDEALWGSDLIEGWKGMGIELPASTKTDNVKDLAIAVCKAWPGLEGSPQKLAVRFSKKQGRYERFNFEHPQLPVNSKSNTYAVSDANYGVVVYNTVNGWFYVECESEQKLDAALWKRDNGHKLLIVTLTYESSSCSSQVCMAYDYDPTTRTLTPDLTVHKRLTQLEGTLCELPRKGKNVGVRSIRNDTKRFYYLKWNGNGFSASVKVAADAYKRP